MNGKDRINIHIGTDDDMNQSFIDAWHKAEQGVTKEPEEHLFFEDAATLLKVLSNQRLALLSTLHRMGDSSIRALSKELHRNYKNTYNDVQILKRAGLIHETPAKKIFVPWGKIHTEIDLTA